MKRGLKNYWNYNTNDANVMLIRKYANRFAVFANLHHSHKFVDWYYAYQR